ncbi:MAG: hypothetical protein ACHP9Z_29715 [Streptosporangiales bacterium]
MTMTASCAAPHCSRPVPRSTTGRPGRYCSPACRQAAYRERARQAAVGQARAAQLADAKATAARLWRPLEQCGFSDLPELAAAVVAYAGDPDETRAGLAKVLTRLQETAERLAGLALGYRDATDTAARLTAGGPQDTGTREGNRNAPVTRA